MVSIWLNGCINILSFLFPSLHSTSVFSSLPASLSTHQLSICQTPNPTHPVPSLTSLPCSILLRPIKSYHEANCLFDQLSMDQELEAFSRLSVRGETDEAGGRYGCVEIMRLTPAVICWLVYFISFKFAFPVFAGFQNRGTRVNDFQHFFN